LLWHVLPKIITVILPARLANCLHMQTHIRTIAFQVPCCALLTPFGQSARLHIYTGVVTCAPMYSARDNAWRAHAALSCARSGLRVMFRRLLPGIARVDNSSGQLRLALGTAHSPGEASASGTRSHANCIAINTGLHLTRSLADRLVRAHRHGPCWTSTQRADSSKGMDLTMLLLVQNCKYICIYLDALDLTCQSGGALAPAQSLQ
jgi:hypothetical protein